MVKSQVLKWAGYVGIVIVISFVVVIVYVTLGYSFSNLANTDVFIAAFMGAFLTFILVKLAELGTHFRKLEKNNLDTLVTTSHDLSDNLNKLHNNDFVAKDILATLAIAKNDQTAGLQVNFNFFKALPIDRTRIIHLKNNLFLNELFGYFADIEKLNDTMGSVQSLYNLLISTKLSGQLDDDSYKFNLDMVEKKLKEVRKFINAATDKTIDLSAKAKLLLKYRSWSWRLVIRVKPMEDYSTAIKDELDGTVKSIWNDIHATEDADTARIKEIIETEID